MNTHNLCYRHYCGNDGGDQDVPWNTECNVIGKGQAQRRSQSKGWTCLRDGHALNGRDRDIRSRPAENSEQGIGADFERVA